MIARFVPLNLKDFVSARPADERRNSQFKAGWGKTIDLLDYELKRVGAHDVVVQAGFLADQIRLDGWPYGKAVPSHPAVILSFRNADNNALSFPCDTYRSIDDNLRAIALSLEALRAVNRFGVTRRNEQYMGFRAIEAPRPMTVYEAAGWIAPFDPDVDVLADAQTYRHAYRKAAAALHPDRGGSDAHWHKLAEAKAILDLHFGLGTAGGSQ